MHILNIARHTPANGSVVSQPVAVRIRRKTHAQFDARVLECVTQSTTIHSIFFSGESKRPADFCPAGMRWSAREAAGTTSHELPQGRIEKGVAAECSDSVWRPGLYLSIAPSHLSLSGSRTETGGSGRRHLFPDNRRHNCDRSRIRF